MPEDSLTNEASNQAQLHQDQVSTLVLQPSSQALLPISAEHLGQDVKSDANSSPQFLLSQCRDPAALVLIQDSSINEAPNQAQLHQDQVSVLVLKSSSQVLPQISAEHLEQRDVESEAKSPFQSLSQSSSQLLLPVSVKHLERDVESKEKDTRSKNKSMDHISLMRMLIRRMNKNAGIGNRTILVKQVWEMDSIHASWMNLYALSLKHPSHAMMSLETIFKIYATGIT